MSSRDWSDRFESNCIYPAIFFWKNKNSGNFMSGNLFGSAFKVMTFGESHGPYIGLVIDGVKPGLPVDLEMLQRELDRRRPGQSKVVTSRQEADRAVIISGVFEGKTTGTPLCILIKNQDQRSGDYQKLQNILRPGHGNFTFLQKYGIFDYRGGGRASGRETAARVAAGALAKQFLKDREIDIIAYTKQIFDIKIDTIDYAEIERNAVRAPDAKAAQKMVKAILKAREEGDSIGGIIEIVVKNCPPGLGEPVFFKLQADLAQALLSIGAVKAFEMGSGFNAATQRGSEHNDLYYFDNKKKKFRTRTNHAGGVIGGISNGEDLIMRITVKPPSSINKIQQTVNLNRKKVQLEIGGRHDPCICPRIVPVAEAMVALVLIDFILMQERISQEPDLQNILSKINTIDFQLLLLLMQRRELAANLSGLKKQNKLQFHERTNQIWSQLATENNFPLEKMKKLIDVLFEK
jgi:chorismate synthase